MGWLSVIFGMVRGIGALLLRLFSVLRASKWGQWFTFYLLTYMGGVLGRILLLLGVTLVVNEWLTPEITPLIAQHFLNLPPVWIQLVALTKLDKALTIIISAMAIAVADKVSVQRRRNAWQTPL